VKNFLNWVSPSREAVMLISIVVLFLHKAVCMVLLFLYASGAVNHLDYLGVQVAWISGPWFLSIFINMLPWESGELGWFHMALHILN